jgi:hypothetical protein
MRPPLRRGALIALSVLAISTATTATHAVAKTSAASELRCTRWGFGESEGGATCDGNERFKVRVWCTWGGSGTSRTFRFNDNWAGCSRGVIHWDDPNAIEIIPET